VAAEAHASYVRRVPGLRLVGQTRTGLGALRRLHEDPVDLVLLDIQLPDIDGLEVLRRMRAAGHRTDVMTMTRARDPEVVQAAVAFGATHYLLKPFTYAAARRKLEQYLAYRAGLRDGTLIAQADVDQLVGALRESSPGPAGASRDALTAAAEALRAAPGMSAAEVADQLGASRATARRCLEYLHEAGLAERHTRYGGSAGRPDVEYRWCGESVRRRAAPPR
jgi:response regulator of citrate/malate metabolism